MNEERLIQLLFEVGKLKKIVRTGWQRVGVPEPESVAEHVFRTSLAGAIIAEAMGLDAGRTALICLVHDMAEAITGDITPQDGITPEEKNRLEKQAMEKLLDGVTGGEKIFDLWLEYEEGKTPESHLARNIDKLEMAIQAKEYQKENHSLDLNEFVQSADIAIDIPEIKSLLKRLENKS